MVTSTLSITQKNKMSLHLNQLHQMVAVKTRSVPLEVAPIELLKSRKENTRHIVGSSQASEDQEVNSCILRMQMKIQISILLRKHRRILMVVKMCLCSENVTSVVIRDPGIMNGSRF